MKKLRRSQQERRILYIVILNGETLRVHPKETKLSDELVIDEKELHEEVRKLLRRADPENIKKILLEERKLNPMSGIALGKSRVWTNLEELCLNNNQIGFEGTVVIGPTNQFRRCLRFIAYPLLYRWYVDDLIPYISEQLGANITFAYAVGIPHSVPPKLGPMLLREEWSTADKSECKDCGVPLNSILTLKHL